MGKSHDMDIFKFERILVKILKRPNTVGYSGARGKLICEKKSRVRLPLMKEVNQVNGKEEKLRTKIWELGEHDDGHKFKKISANFRPKPKILRH